MKDLPTRQQDARPRPQATPASSDGGHSSLIPTSVATSSYEHRQGMRAPKTVSTTRKREGWVSIADMEREIAEAVQVADSNSSGSST